MSDDANTARGARAGYTVLGCVSGRRGVVRNIASAQPARDVLDLNVLLSRADAGNLALDAAQK